MLPAVRLTTESALNLSESTKIVIVTKKDGSFIERVEIVRYAGHYRTDGNTGIEAFMVRDDKGKVRVRSDHDLGLSDVSTKTAYIAATYSDGAAVA